MENKKNKINKIFDRMTNNKLIHEAILLVENSSGDFSYHKGYGGKDIDTPFAMASITKLLTTTCIFILNDQKQLFLSDKLTKYFKEDTLRELHLYKGKEYSKDLTVANLLFQTSGLPDYFEEGSKEAKQRAIYKDMDITFDEKIALTKQLKAHFAPSLGKRAHYSDINFDMLGEIIERVTNSTLEDVFEKYIFSPLGLKDTYLQINDENNVPHVYYKNNPLNRPKFIKTSRASGGCISTARELMVFTKAFFAGKLFDQSVFHQLQDKNRLQATMFPIHYGAGFMRIPLNGIVTFFIGKGELIGHSGSTGSFAFYNPLKDLFFVGDVNQMANPAFPIRLTIRLAVTINK